MSARARPLHSGRNRRVCLSTRDGPITRTGKDGRFVLYSSEEDPKPVWLVLRESEPGGPAPKGPWFQWGTKDIRLVLDTSERTPPAEFPSLSLTVVEAGSRNPVEDFYLRCFPEGANSSLQKGMRLGDRHVTAGSRSTRFKPESTTCR